MEIFFRRINAYVGKLKAFSQDFLQSKVTAYTQIHREAGEIQNWRCTVKQAYYRMDLEQYQTYPWHNRIMCIEAQCLAPG